MSDRSNRLSFTAGFSTGAFSAILLWALNISMVAAILGAITTSVVLILFADRSDIE